MDYTNDIFLIDIIIEKNYINYFHYINIQQCLYYIQGKYEGSMKIKYNRYYSDNIRIFGENFVKNNKNTCYIIYESEKYELTEYFKINNWRHDVLLEIKLIGINNIINASHMFYGCKSLKSLSDISKWNTNNVTDMSYMFSWCTSLKSLPDISEWDTNNVTDMSYMFFQCKSLYLLPDISNWNTNNVTDMSYMFKGCESLNSLPDISKWNINNVTYMSWMFDGCKSLKFIGEKYFSNFLELWKKNKK